MSKDLLFLIVGVLTLLVTKFMFDYTFIQTTALFFILLIYYALFIMEEKPTTWKDRLNQIDQKIKEDELELAELGNELEATRPEPVEDHNLIDGEHRLYSFNKFLESKHKTQALESENEKLKNSLIRTRELDKKYFKELVTENKKLKEELSKKVTKKPIKYPWNKGKKLSKAHKDKIKRTMEKKWKKGFKGMTGKHHSKKTKELIKKIKLKRGRK